MLNTGTMKTIIYYLRLLAVLILIAGPSRAAAEEQFIGAIDDLPLMAGLKVIDGGSMVFDSPAGRIVDVLSVGEVANEDVLRYYSKTLPQLGWRQTGPGQFSREGEMLRLEFSPAQGISGSTAALLNVRFMLSPLK